MNRPKKRTAVQAQGSKELNNVTITVVVRCRPMSEDEIREGSTPVVDLHPKRGVIYIDNPRSGGGRMQFTFDAVYDEFAKQEAIYDETVRPVTEQVLGGFNGTIFAYGQTGTGKTYTMEGMRKNHEKRGIIPNAFEHLFNQIARSTNQQYLVSVSFIEIYLENLRDLLEDKQKKLVIRETSSGVRVSGMSSFVCKSVTEIDRLYKLGKRNRTTSSTKMNEHSSRSHAIFMITVECSDSCNRIKVGRLNLVDLAGSERQCKAGTTGDRLKEAAKINLSLSALGNVISALATGKSQHIPYRDSKLTRILQDSLGGNSYTVMVANIGPASINHEETLTTLRYANRAKNIKNVPQVNEDPKDALLREFQEEITRLRSLLIQRQEEVARRQSLSVSPSQPSTSSSTKKRPRKSKHGAEKIESDSSETTEDDKISNEFLITEIEFLEKERQKVVNDSQLISAEKEKLLAQLEEKSEMLQQERALREPLLTRINELESQLLRGGKNIIDHTNEQERALEMQRQEIAEQKVSILSVRELEKLLDTRMIRRRIEAKMTVRRPSRFGLRSEYTVHGKDGPKKVTGYQLEGMSEEETVTYMSMLDLERMLDAREMRIRMETKMSMRRSTRDSEQQTMDIFQREPGRMKDTGMQTECESVTEKRRKEPVPQPKAEVREEEVRKLTTQEADDLRFREYLRKYLELKVATGRNARDAGQRMASNVQDERRKEPVPQPKAEVQEEEVRKLTTQEADDLRFREYLRKYLELKVATGRNARDAGQRMASNVQDERRKEPVPQPKAEVREEEVRKLTTQEADDLRFREYLKKYLEPKEATGRNTRDAGQRMASNVQDERRKEPVPQPKAEVREEEVRKLTTQEADDLRFREYLRKYLEPKEATGRNTRDAGQRMASNVQDERRKEPVPQPKAEVREEEVRKLTTQEADDLRFREYLKKYLEPKEATGRNTRDAGQRIASNVQDERMKEPVPQPKAEVQEEEVRKLTTQEADDLWFREYLRKYLEPKVATGRNARDAGQRMASNVQDERRKEPGPQPRAKVQEEKIPMERRTHDFQQQMAELVHEERRKEPGPQPKAEVREEEVHMLSLEEAEDLWFCQYLRKTMGSKETTGRNTRDAGQRMAGNVQDETGRKREPGMQPKAQPQKVKSPPCAAKPKPTDAKPEAIMHPQVYNALVASIKKLLAQVIVEGYYLEEVSMTSSCPEMDTFICLTDTVDVLSMQLPIKKLDDMTLDELSTLVIMRALKSYICDEKALTGATDMEYRLLLRLFRNYRERIYSSQVKSLAERLRDREKKRYASEKTICEEVFRRIQDTRLHSELVLHIPDRELRERIKLAKEIAVESVNEGPKITYRTLRENRPVMSPLKIHKMCAMRLWWSYVDEAMDLAWQRKHPMERVEVSIEEERFPLERYDRFFTHGAKRKIHEVLHIPCVLDEEIEPPGVRENWVDAILKEAKKNKILYSLRRKRSQRKATEPKKAETSTDCINCRHKYEMEQDLRETLASAKEENESQWQTKGKHWMDDIIHPDNIRRPEERQNAGQQDKEESESSIGTEGKRWMDDIIHPGNIRRHEERQNAGLQNEEESESSIDTEEIQRMDDIIQFENMRRREERQNAGQQNNEETESIGEAERLLWMDDINYYYNMRREERQYAEQQNKEESEPPNEGERPDLIPFYQLFPLEYSRRPGSTFDVDEFFRQVTSGEPRRELTKEESDALILKIMLFDHEDKILDDMVWFYLNTIIVKNVERPQPLMSRGGTQSEYQAVVDALEGYTGPQSLDVLKRKYQRERREVEMLQKLEEKDNSTLDLKETFSSLQQENESKTKKLRKMFAKLESIQQEIRDAFEEANDDRREMEANQKNMLKELKLLYLIIDNFIPVEEKNKLLSRIRYNNEDDKWFILPLDKMPVNLPRLKSRPTDRRPTTDHSRAALIATDSPRYKGENVVYIDLEMPLRTTQDYEMNDSTHAVRAVLQEALEHEETVLEINCNAPHLTKRKARAMQRSRARSTPPLPRPHTSAGPSNPPPVYPVARGLVPK